VCLGLKFETHEATPGPAAAPCSNWPTGSALVADASRPTILFFIHPQCPCTRASLNELDRILSSYPGKAKVIAVVLSPKGMAADWSETDTTEHARRLPDATMVKDPDGAECKRFGVKTSGTVLVFSPGGSRELFRGGLTASRGHEGESAGGAAISHYLETGQMTINTAPVFGCFLF
jgi:hypothetical protein